MARVLVAYYSRSGTTRRVATEIAQALGADLAEIRSRRRRTGVVGYLRSAVEAMLEAGAQIDPVAADPARYDLVVLGSPVWYASLSSPLRTFVWQHRDAFKDVAFFCTQGARGGGRAADQLASECRKDLRLTLILREAEVAQGSAAGKIREFAHQIQRRLEAAKGDGVAAARPPAT